MRALLLLTATACCALGAQAATWRPVPGADALDIDLASLHETDRGKALAWLRWPGKPAAGLVPAGFGATPVNAHRTAAQVEFDCGKRAVRALATTAYDARGAAISMASIPGPVMSVRNGDLAWAYDAVCEALRASGRS